MMPFTILVLLIQLLACLKMTVALNTNIFTKEVAPADLQSDIAALYEDAYLKEWLAYSNEYQRLFREYSQYYSSHCCTLKRKRSFKGALIENDFFFPESLQIIFP